MHLRDAVTLLTTFKPFEGESALLQNTAIDTWRFHKIPAIVFGDEHGSGKAVDILKARHVPEVSCSASGVPYISDMIMRGCSIAETDYVALVNGDICLDTKFVRALEQAINCISQKPDQPYFFSARRRNIPIWERGANPALTMDIIEKTDATYGCWDKDNAIDIFVFPKNLYDKIPDMAVGRSGWDNWLLAEAKKQGAALVDLTLSASLKHPIHGYVGPMGGWEKLLVNAETRENQRLVAGHVSSFDDMAYVLKDGQIISKSPNHSNAIKKHTQSTFGRELKGMLKYMATALLTDEEKTDVTKTVFWRNDIFFPVSYSNQLRNRDIESAQSALEVDGTAAAVAILQDALGVNLLEAMRVCSAENRQLVVWGAGGLAERFLDWFERQNIDVVPLIVGKGQGSNDLRGYAIRDSAACHELDRPLTFIASMHVREIKSENKALFDRIGAQLIF